MLNSSGGESTTDEEGLSDEDTHAEKASLLGGGTAGGSERVGKLDVNGEVPKKPVSVFGLVVIAFFWVCGGIYGAEEIMSSAPPRHVFASMIITPVLFGLPAALMNAEMSTSYPVTGGYVVWVEDALGKTVGTHNSVWRWLTCVLDAAMYPQLVVSYAIRVLPWVVTKAQQTALMLSLVCCILLINLGGVELMLKMETCLLVFSLLPTVVFVMLGLSRISLPILWAAGEPCCSVDCLAMELYAPLPNCSSLTSGTSMGNLSVAAMCHVAGLGAHGVGEEQ